MQFRLDQIRSSARRLGWLAFVLLGTAAGSAAEPYLLSVSDKLTIKVVEWQAAESTFEEWTALGGDYVIGADGTANFPMVGPTESAGKTTAQLATDLAAALQQSLGLTTAPTVTVEIAEYGPIYVSGDVNSPGEYPFAPNLTVVKALTLAGGERRASEAGARPERELLSTAGALDVLKDEHLRLVIRRARLDAELAGEETVTLPPELEGAPGVEPLLAAEQAILEAHSRQAAAQTTSLTEEVALLTNQVGAFDQKQVSTEEQLAAARDQLAKISQLSDEGLALASRVATVQTNVADLEARLLDTRTAALQAQQDIAEAEREQAQLSDQRVSDLSLERQTVDGQIAALELKIGTQGALVEEAALYTGTAVPGQTQPVFTYTIIRDGEEIAAEPNTLVQAGDVVMARLSLATP